MKIRTLLVAAAPLLAFSLPATAAASPSALSAAIEAITTRPAAARAAFGIEFYDLDRGQIIYAKNAHTIFRAASTTKLVTEATTLKLLGPDYRFHTDVYATGPIGADGVLDGDVVLRASGDPNLSNRIRPGDTLTFQNEDHSYDGSPDTKAVAGDPLAVMRELAAKIAAKGVKKVAGRVVVDYSLFPEGEAEGGTGAIISPIVVNDNLIDITLTPGAVAGDPVTMTVAPQTAYATFTNLAKTGVAKGDRTIDFGADETDGKGNHAISIIGTLPAGGKPILYAYRVPVPHRFAEIALAQALHDLGIEASTDVPVGRGTTVNFPAFYTPEHLLAEHVSPPLSEDVYVTLKVSDNLHASMQPYLWGTLLAHARANPVRAGFALEQNYLRSLGLDLTGADQSDGLGDVGYFAPDFMVSLLRQVAKTSYFAKFDRALPVIGVDGTLFNIQNGKPVATHVHAKTGTWSAADTLNGGTLVSAKGLAGYMTTKSGRHLVFCLYANNYFVKHNADPAGEGHVVGQVLGEITNAAYLYAK